MTAVVIDGTGALTISLKALFSVQDGVNDHPEAGIIIVAAGDVPSILARIRAETSTAPAAPQAIVIVVEDAVFEPLDVHVLLAAVEPLAIGAAPTRRVSAVQVRSGARPADVAAGIAYLLGATSVTGQIIRIDQGFGTAR